MSRKSLARSAATIRYIDRIHLCSLLACKSDNCGGSLVGHYKCILQGVDEPFTDADYLLQLRN